MQQYVETDGEGQKAMAETLFRRHASALFAFLRQQTSSREDAEDILLEIFTALLEQKQLGRFSEEEQLLWIWRIARNKIIDRYRRNARHPFLSVEHFAGDQLADTEQTPEQMLVRWEEYAQLHATLRTLPVLQQTILRLRFVYGLRSAEIAAQVGKSEVAVRALFSRTLNRLRKLYREERK
ncbi:MAG TPA: sigma-70 family RNA polymerase sigma factor [Ktedonobacteraceae bacterium]|nr:sigma-70 family RNA polymerase sigma factor [Ktedonobacteraceae bacterium]